MFLYNNTKQILSLLYLWTGQCFGTEFINCYYYLLVIILIIVTKSTQIKKNTNRVLKTIKVVKHAFK